MFFDKEHLSFQDNADPEKRNSVIEVETNIS